MKHLDTKEFSWGRVIGFVGSTQVSEERYCSDHLCHQGSMPTNDTSSKVITTYLLFHNKFKHVLVLLRLF